MKNLQVVSPLLTLLLGSIALAQAGNLPEAPQPQDSESTQLQSTPVANSEESAQPSGDNKLMSQARPYPRFPRRPVGPPRGRVYRSAYSPAYPPPPALSPVGALIGFGFGAALGAAGSGDHTSGGRVAGALIGGGFSLVHSHNFREWEGKQPSRPDRRDLQRPRESDVDASSGPASSTVTTAMQTGGQSEAGIAEDAEYGRRERRGDPVNWELR
jgi:hypothetical protein